MGKADSKPLLIKRYASRRLYNTETSDYVTLDDISGFIKEGRDVQIIDLKSGDDLTRQYLLQIIADNESKGENVLPINVLTDLVRSYATNAQSMVPDFLSASFEMLREGQSKMVESISSPMTAVPGFEQIKAQQEAFMKSMMGGWTGPGSDDYANTESAAKAEKDDSSELEAIKKQLADMQAAVAKMGK
ncbi:polyhydroxyalkanoate synthesis repressor PhaR [Litoreibacter meonggei]|uniref:Polyhydroxyalkanoate synthesis repressor PhaR n=1 Tax=Litoreibacter meonggei TaxID=1049199 RepID=A0A497X544_9RHOB|nr:polyhydroxyalkanoate synthesis repressor PhaR [Litoreibacter meonggei]RLJ60223.1 polyhydroxyalkanoate synthesis repressor PhaR [Litoreibacter meonggei]